MLTNQFKSSPQQRKLALDYYYKNREKRKKQMRLWAKNNREYRTEYFRKYRKTAKGKEAVLRAVKKYERNNPDRKRTWQLAQCLEKKPCEICGKTPTHRHHPDISKPLEVKFLCPLHHKQAHSL